MDEMLSKSSSRHFVKKTPLQEVHRRENLTEREINDNNFRIVITDASKNENNHGEESDEQREHPTLQEISEKQCGVEKNDERQAVEKVNHVISVEKMR